MSNGKSLGDRMKRYEVVSKNFLMARTPVILRLDGCHFHTFTKDFVKPFDELLIDAMQRTLKYLCEHIQGCVFGYTQSDEITLVLIDYNSINTASWYDNEVQKMCSVASSLCTFIFNKYFSENVLNADTTTDKLNKVYSKAINMGAFFDCRAFNVPKEEVCNCILWRQQDATRNSIQSLAQAHFSHKELMGLTCDVLQDKLFTERGINWNDLEPSKKRGTSCIRKTVSIPCETGEGFVDRSRWVLDLKMPILTKNREYINQLIFID